MVNDSVLFGFFRRHEEVSFGVLLDLLGGFSDMLCKDVVEDSLVSEQFIDLDFDVYTVPSNPPEG